MPKQTIEQALHLIRTEQSKNLVIAANRLEGCQVGGWPETKQGKQELADQLPVRDRRDYTVREFIGAVYDEQNGRYRRKIQ